MDKACGRHGWRRSFERGSSGDNFTDASRVAGSSGCVEGAGAGIRADRPRAAWVVTAILAPEALKDFQLFDAARVGVEDLDLENAPAPAQARHAEARARCGWRYSRRAYPPPSPPRRPRSRARQWQSRPPSAPAHRQGTSHPVELPRRAQNPRRARRRCRQRSASTTSSIETTPSAPPYSSTMSARWMRLVCIRASKSMTGIDGGTNSISRTILAADSGVARSTAFRSSPAGNGFLRRVLVLAPTAARAVM